MRAVRTGSDPRTRRRSGAPARRRGLFLLFAALTTAACLAAAAAPSLANIEDPAAEPNHQALLDRAGVDYAEDVVIVGDYVYVCGQVESGATDADASLVRMPVRGGTHGPADQRHLGS